MRILVYGAGYVGLTSAAILAQCHDVIVVELDHEKVSLINKGVAPISETGLEPMLSAAIKRGTLAATETDSDVGPFDIIMVCVGTPSDNNGEVDLSYVRSVSDSVRKGFKHLSRDYTVIALRSTVPPGTTRSLFLNPLLKHQKSKDFGVVFQPEFLRESSAIQDQLNPDRIVIGYSDSRALAVYRTGIIEAVGTYRGPILEMGLESAELCKYANNCFLAMKVSFSNEIAALAELLPGVNIDDVMDAIGSDHRISPSHLRPGLGYGGPCLPKDVNALICFAKHIGVPTELASATSAVNAHVTDRLLRLLQVHGENLTAKKIAVLGVAFKKGTDDYRGSQSVALIEKLTSLGAEVFVHDPAVDMNRALSSQGTRFRVSTTVEECVRNADALVLMTDWDEYSQIGLHDLTREMKSKTVIDGVRLFSRSRIPPDVVYRPLGTSPQTTD